MKSQDACSGQLGNTGSIVALAYKAYESSLSRDFCPFCSLSPVLKRAAVKHMPVDLMGPQQIDEFVRDIRQTYGGPLQIAHDLMRIDL